MRRPSAGTFPPASATSDVNEEKEALAVWLRRRRRMQHLEAEIAADRFFELGKRTLAVLQGEFARFEMRSKEVVLGRAVDGAPVDFDLSKAGPATRVSARQVRSPGRQTDGGPGRSKRRAHRGEPF